FFVFPIILGPKPDPILRGGSREVLASFDAVALEITTLIHLKSFGLLWQYLSLAHGESDIAGVE
ncbi:hypothetical protein, partial [Sodaliphilus sp.]|uniref:hypothetical protein n=1 Tax=Sodaliphilus sp. TaxID=2815818 RepID=UPI00388FB302